MVRGTRRKFHIATRFLMYDLLGILLRRPVGYRVRSSRRRIPKIRRLRPVHAYDLQVPEKQKNNNRLIANTSTLILII